MVEPAAQAEAIPAAVFGPVIEQELQGQATGTNQFLNLDKRQLLTPSPEIANVLTSPPNEDDSRIWEGLDIPQDSSRFRYIKWLQENGADLMYAGDGKIIGFDGIFVMAHGDSSSNWDNWDALTPEQVRAGVEVVDWVGRATEAQAQGLAAPPAPKSGGVYKSAGQMDSREPGGPVVNLLTRDQSVNWYFKTRQGRMGILQLVSFTGNPPIARIRYKLVEPVTDQDARAGGRINEEARGSLSERLEAASSITDVTEKDKPLTAVAIDAAKTGEVSIAKRALDQIYIQEHADTATHDTAMILAKDGLRMQAIEMAKGITDYTTRNQTLAELAQ